MAYDPDPGDDDVPEVLGYVVGDGATADEVTFRRFIPEQQGRQSQQQGINMSWESSNDKPLLCSQMEATTFSSSRSSLQEEDHRHPIPGPSSSSSNSSWAWGSLPGRSRGAQRLRDRERRRRRSRKNGRNSHKRAKSLGCLPDESESRPKIPLLIDLEPSSSSQGEDVQVLEEFEYTATPSECSTRLDEEEEKDIVNVSSSGDEVEDQGVHRVPLEQQQQQQSSSSIVVLPSRRTGRPNSSGSSSSSSSLCRPSLPLPSSAVVRSDEEMRSGDGGHPVPGPSAGHRGSDNRQEGVIAYRCPSCHHHSSSISLLDILNQLAPDGNIGEYLARNLPAGTLDGLVAAAARRRQTASVDDDDGDDNPPAPDWVGGRDCGTPSSTHSGIVRRACSCAVSSAGIRNSPVAEEEDPPVPGAAVEGAWSFENLFDMFAALGD